MGKRVRVTHRGVRSALNPGGSHSRYGIVRKRKKGEEMEENELVSFLARKIQSCMNDEDGDISSVRQENFNYYMGKLYGNEREGYSKFVTREVLETVEWVLPAVLRVFVGGDEVVSFDAETSEDEEQAKQETDIVNHTILKSNNGQGFLALHHWFKDALMAPTAYIKVDMEESEKTSVGTYTGLNEYGVAEVLKLDGVSILEQRERIEPITITNEDGSRDVQRLVVYDLKIRRTYTQRVLRLMAVPPEEALIDNNCLTVDTDQADFVAHRVQKSYTDLVEAGYDPDELDEVGNAENHTFNDERTNRLFYEDEDPHTDELDDPSMRRFWVHECYARVDFDGDRIAEHRKVVLIGDKVFENVELNYQPIVAMSSILIPHKHNGMSYSDIVKDLQLLTSTLTRQLLDNIYRINIRRKAFSEDALTEDGATLEALLNPQAEFIPVRGLPQHAFQEEGHQSVVAELLPVIQDVRNARKMRSGISPDLNLDPNVLQEVRQDVFTSAVDQASQRIEMLVRIFAETGIRQLFLKVHQLMRSNWDIAKTMKIRGKWVNVDPTGWMDRTDLTCNVGLGFNNKQRTLMMLSQLLTMQKEAAGYGLTDPKKVYNILSRWTQAANLGDGSIAFIDPSEPGWQPPQPQPDANMILAEAQAKALDSESKTKQSKVQADMQLAGQKMFYERQKATAELRDKRQDREIRLRELALKQYEITQTVPKTLEEIDAKVENLRQDTELKAAQAEKADADAVKSLVESGEDARFYRHHHREVNESEMSEQDTSSSDDQS